MTTKTTAAPLTKDDLDALAEHVATLREFGVFSISTYAGRERVHLTHFIEAVTLLGITPNVKATEYNFLFVGDFRHGGIEFSGAVRAEDLPSIGYHLVDGKPVPKTA